MKICFADSIDIDIHFYCNFEFFSNYEAALAHLV